jgi:hypothetical protein
MSAALTRFAASLGVLRVLQSVRRDESRGWTIDLQGAKHELLAAGAATSEMFVLPPCGKRIGLDAAGDRYRVWRCGIGQFGVTRWLSGRPSPNAQPEPNPASPTVDTPTGADVLAFPVRKVPHATLSVDSRIGIIRLLRGLEAVGLTLSSVRGELIIRDHQENHT